MPLVPSDPTSRPGNDPVPQGEVRAEPLSTSNYFSHGMSASWSGYGKSPQGFHTSYIHTRGSEYYFFLKKTTFPADDGVPELCGDGERAWWKIEKQPRGGFVVDYFRP